MKGMTIELSEYVIDAIADAVAWKMQNPNLGWIPVSKKLPRVDEDVIALDCFGGILKAGVYDDCGELAWCTDDSWNITTIVAWMPLPKYEV